MKSLKRVFILIMVLGVFSSKAQNYQSYVLDRTIPYNWVSFEPVVPTELLALAGEDEVYTVPLPFAFRYFDSTYTSLFAGINGYVSFGRNYNQSDFNREHLCNPVPQTYNPAGEQNSLNPDNFIAAFWDDLFLDGTCTPLDGGTPKLAYRTVGTAPNRIFIIVWDYFVTSGDLAPCATVSPEFAQQVNVQLKLYEGTNVIEVHLKNNQLTSQEATIAVENADGSYAEYAHCSANNPPPAGPIAYRFTPSVDPPVAGPNTYCTASAEDCSAATRWISNVQMSNLQNRTTCSPNGYSDFTNLGPIRVDSGSTYQLIVNTLTFTNGGYITRVWVDWNRDTLFSADELYPMAGTSSGLATGEGLYTVALTPPLGTTPGLVRMRIRHTFATNNIEACGAGTIGEIEDYHILVNTPNGYCAAQGGTCPGTGTADANYDYIRSADFTTDAAPVNNVSNCNNGYGDFTNNPSLLINWSAGGNYTAVIKRLVPDYINAKAGLWVDWNQDQDFDDLNEYFPGVANINDSTTTFAIVVPNGANLGYTRLRVRTTSSATSNANPCGVQTNGEVEDYDVLLVDPNINPPACVSTTSPIDNATDLCQNVTLNWDVVQDADGYKLSLKENNSSVFLVQEFNTTATSYTISGKLTPGQTYAWIAVPYNQDGDALSCDTLRFTIAVNGDPVVNITPAFDTIFQCSATPFNLDANPQLGTQPYSHSWDGTDNDLLSDTAIANPDFLGASSGTFKYNYTITDANNCIAQDSTVIKIVPAVIAGSLQATDSDICSGSSSSFVHSGFVGNVQIQDSIAGGSWNDVNLNQINANEYSTGVLTQTRFYRAIVSAGSCGDTSLLIAVTVHPIPNAPVVQANGPTTFCFGDSVSLVVTNYASGLVWNDPAMTSGPVLKVKMQGSYSVTYTDAFGCSAVSNATSVTVNVSPNKPQIQFAGRSNTCLGDSIVMFVNNPNNDMLMWNDPNQTTNDTLVVYDAGTFNVTASASGCSTKSEDVSVAFDFTPEKPTVRAEGSTLVCQGQSVTLISSYSSDILWNTGQSNDTITVNTSGSYSVTYTDASGCSATSDPFSVNFVAPPAKPQVILVGDSLMSSVQGYAYQWIGPFGPISGANKRYYKPLTTGDYRVVVYTFEGCGSPQSDSYYYAISGIHSYNKLLAAIFPNPAHDIVTLQLSEELEAEVKIFNTLGQLILSQTGLKNQSTIDIGQLNSGTYVVQIISSGGQTYISFIKD